MKKLYRTTTTLTLMLAICVIAGSAQAQVMTTPDAQVLFPAYNMAQQTPGAFDTPCVDAFGTMTIVANVGDITQDTIAVAMVCQAIGYPPYMANGTVTFDVPNAYLINHFQAPGFPDAFGLEFAIPLGTQIITISISDTGWPEGCIDPGDFIDFAGYEDLSVSNESISWGSLQALYR